MPMQGSSHPHAAVVPTQNPPDSAQGLPTAGARGFLPPGQADSSAYVDHAGGHCIVTTNAGCIHTSCGWRGGVKVHEAAGQAGRSESALPGNSGPTSVPGQSMWAMAKETGE